MCQTLPAEEQVKDLGTEVQKALWKSLFNTLSPEVTIQNSLSPQGPVEVVSNSICKTPQFSQEERDTLQDKNAVTPYSAVILYL